MQFLRKASSYIVFVVLVVGFVLTWSNRNTIGDWFALRNYQPANEIVQLTERTTMTQQAKTYFYVNHPELNDREAFNKHCTNDREQSVVLGCFLGNRNGIYIFNVTTPELDGVREVTAAHEMLHQAYERLSASERKRIDGLLDTYYRNNLQNETIKKQIELYKKADPAALPNELHSLFGTQVADLPQELEEHYRIYFADRAKVVAYYDKYQRAFTARKEQIATYDAQLAGLKRDIETLEPQLQTQLRELDTMRDDMDRKRASDQIEAYNALVPTYNNAVHAYNDGVDELRQKINTYNGIVEKRNAIADQEQKLQKSLSSKALPTQPGE